MRITFLVSKYVYSSWVLHKAVPCSGLTYIQSLYSGDLNSKLVGYSDHVGCLLLDWFAIQMPGTMVVRYSDHHLINVPVFRAPFEY